jgi:hypothetical protein
VRGVLALASVSALLGLAAPAAAQVVTLRPHSGPVLREGPVLAGERVAWSQTACVAGCSADEGASRAERYELLVTDGQAPARRLFRARLGQFDSGPNYFFEGYSFLLSEQVLATLYQSFRGDELDVDTERVELRAGAPGASGERVVRCSSERVPEVDVALDGTLLAYDADACDDTARFVVRDVLTGEVRALPNSPTGTQLRLRGRFAAWLEAEGTRLVVYDHVAGATAYSAPTADVLDLALDADGSVAGLTGRQRRPCTTGRLFRFSAAQPTPTPVPVPVCATGGLRMEAGHIVFLGWEGFTRTLRRVDPAGQVEDLVRFGRVTPGHFDAEGERLAWAARGCGGGSEIFTATLAEAPLAAGSVNCPARLRSGRVPVRRGRATVTLACPRGCSGEISLRHAGRRDFGLLRGESTVTVRLGRRARARLERRGSLTTIARLVWRNRAGDRLARSRAVTLVAR